MLGIKQKIAKNYINAIGWSTNRKLLLIESDDWGAIRMPNKKTYNDLLSQNIAVDRSYFDKNDSLESAEDLQNLYEVLSSVVDINGNYACMTAFSVVANPDFERISQNNKMSYIYEPVTETYKRHQHTSGSFDLFLEGSRKRLLYPQFHGREHLNTVRWIEAINSRSLKEHIAYENQSFIGAEKLNDSYKYPLGYMAGFNWSDVDEVNLQKEILADGLNLFKELFGYESISFMAPQSIWSNEINKTLFDNSVRLQVGQQYAPQGNNQTKLINNKWGSKSIEGLTYWRRNCQFEPSRNQNQDWVNSALQEIEIAFRWGKPAVINSHRVNYIGSIFPENRDQSLSKLKTLLIEVQKRWPEVEFIDTERLAHIMLEKDYF